MIERVAYRVTFIKPAGVAATVTVVASNRGEAARLGLEKLEKLTPGRWSADDHAVTRRESSRSLSNGRNGTLHV